MSVGQLVQGGRFSGHPRDRLRGRGGLPRKQRAQSVARAWNHRRPPPHPPPRGPFWLLPCPWPVADLEANFGRQGSGRESEPNLIPSLPGGDSWNPSFRPLSLCSRNDFREH